MVNDLRVQQVFWSPVEIFRTKVWLSKAGISSVSSKDTRERLYRSAERKKLQWVMLRLTEEPTHTKINLPNLHKAQMIDQTPVKMQVCNEKWKPCNRHSKNLYKYKRSGYSRFLQLTPVQLAESCSCSKMHIMQTQPSPVWICCSGCLLMFLKFGAHSSTHAGLSSLIVFVNMEKYISDSSLQWSEVNCYFLPPSHGQTLQQNHCPFPQSEYPTFQPTP